MIAERIAKRISLQKEYTGQFIILWLVGALAYMGFAFVWPQFSLLITGQGFSLFEFGLIQGAATFLSISSQVYMGKLSDRLDKRKPILVLSLVLSIPVAVLFPHASTLVMFLLLLAVNQLVSALFNATAANWVTRFGANEQMGRLHGFYRISLSFGWILATMFMGTALDYLGVTGTFYLGGGFLAAALLLTVIATKDTPTGPQQIQSGSQEVGGVFVWTPQLKLTLAALGIFTVAQTMGMHLIYIFLKDELQVTNQQFGLLTSIQTWPELPLMLILGIASDRLSNSLLLTGGMLLAGLRYFFLWFVQGVPLLYLIQPIQAVGITITEVVIVAEISRQVPRGFLGTVMGWQVTVVSIARMIAPVLAGVVGEIWSIRAVFFLSAVVSALAGLLVYFSARRKG